MDKTDIQNRTYQQSGDILIHTYCICKNEIKYVDTFLKSIDKTDFLSIMDTGSTDGTYEKLLEYATQDEHWKGRLYVWQKPVIPWRFDAARNESLYGIPDKDFAKEADYYYCIDMDETVTEGFFVRAKERLFDAWKRTGKLPRRLFYKYAWSHTQNGEPDRIFWYDKFHGTKGWIWKGSCHEFLDLDQEYADYYSPNIYIDSGETIWLHHWPDPNKSRGNYLSLLETRCQEMPEDYYAKYYLSREYGFHGMWDKAYVSWLQLYVVLASKSVRDDMLMLPSVTLELAKVCAKNGLNDEAEFYYKKAIELDPKFIDIRINYAQFLAYRGKAGESLSVLQNMEGCQIKYDWRECPHLRSRWKRMQIIADCLCWLGEYKLANQAMTEAISDLNASRDFGNANSENFYADCNFITQKLEEKKEGSFPAK